MAKKTNNKIKMESTAGTGYFKTVYKSSAEKLELSMYDPVVRKHVPFKEKKIKG